LFVIAQISAQWQDPPYQTALPVTVTVTAKIIAVTNTAPYFPKSLTSMTLETGLSGSLPVPITSAKDNENQAITAKVELPAGSNFLKWNSD
jgi:hypothetical protein